MQKFSNISGILGLTLFLFGFVTYLFTEILTLYSIVHLAGGAALMLYFLGVNLGRLRGMLTGRAAKTFGETGVFSVIVLASVIVVNLIANMYPKQFDLTQAGLFSLSEQTQSMLNGLETDVKAIVFQQGGVAQQIEDKLKLYAYEQDRFSYQVVDPERNPETAEAYEVRQNGTVILEAAGRTIKLTEDITEEKITNGIRSLLAGRDTVIGFLTGHGELSLDDDQNAGGLAIFKLLLEEENYQVEAVDIIESGRVPNHIDVLIVASPAQPLFAGEVSAIAAFMQDGGKMLVMTDPLRTGANALLTYMGVENAGSTMLIDQEVRLFAGPTMGTQIMVREYGMHESVESFNSQTVFGQACALQLSMLDGISYTPILESSGVSWAESDLKRLLEMQEAEQGPDDIAGPVALGAAFSGFPRAGTSAGASASAAGFVICDSDFVSNRLIGQAGNADLALNMVAWMVGDTENITIRPKSRGMSQLTLTQDQMVNIFYGTVLIFPELLLLLGLFVWWQRRQRS